MKTITFDRFDLGIDLRKGKSVSDANRLREMLNAYVTTGLAAQKRPGLVKVATLEPGTKGLFAADGQLHTFYGQGWIQHAHGLFKANKVAHPEGERPISEVHFADMVDGHIYTAVEYTDGSLKHHTLDGATPSAITDGECPHSAIVIKAARRLFAVHGNDVRYCTMDRPRLWSQSHASEEDKNKWSKEEKDKWGVDDAGFIATGQYFSGARTVNAFGLYHNNLVMLARDGVQIWQIDTDPKANKLIDRVDNVGTHYPCTLVAVAGDLYFLSDAGFRSMTTLQYTNNLADADIGSPIDPLVREALKPYAALLNGSHALQAMLTPRAWYYTGSGQYLCAIGADVFVYSISRTAKIAAWSRYRFPFAIEAFAELGGVLYLRSGDNVYRLSDESHTDDGQLIEVELALPYMDLKAPGETKRLLGAQVIAEGECTFSVAFDERYPQAATPLVRLRGTTRGGVRIPLHRCGSAFALRFKNRDNKPFRLDAVTLYYEAMGV
jgi:hypothetical protein